MSASSQASLLPNAHPHLSEAAGDGSSFLRSGPHRSQRRPRRFHDQADLRKRANGIFIHDPLALPRQDVGIIKVPIPPRSYAHSHLGADSQKSFGYWSTPFATAGPLSPCLPQPLVCLLFQFALGLFEPLQPTLHPAEARPRAASGEAAASRKSSATPPVSIPRIRKEPLP